MAKWVPEFGSIPIYEGILDFKESALDSHKLTSFVKFDNSFVQDNAFFFSNYLMQRFARVIGKVEEQGFITGTRSNMPYGILHAEQGAEVGFETTTIPQMISFISTSR